MENLLKNEKSPYLKQHENNPVHWFAWNKKALDEANKLANYLNSEEIQDLLKFGHYKWSGWNKLEVIKLLG